MTRLDRRAAAVLLTLSLTACADTYWERSLYEGLRQRADNAARQHGARAVPQTTRLPEHGQYERERQRLLGAQAARPAEGTDGANAAASAAAR